MSIYFILYLIVFVRSVRTYRVEVTFGSSHLDISACDFWMSISMPFFRVLSPSVRLDHSELRVGSIFMLQFICHSSCVVHTIGLYKQHRMGNKMRAKRARVAHILTPRNAVLQDAQVTGAGPCWSVVITSWSRYHTMYARDWGPHRIACARSPLPLSSLILQ